MLVSPCSKNAFPFLPQTHTLKTLPCPSRPNSDVSLSMKISLDLQAELPSPLCPEPSLPYRSWPWPSNESKHHRITGRKSSPALSFRFCSCKIHNHATLGLKILARKGLLWAINEQENKGYKASGVVLGAWAQGMGTKSSVSCAVHYFTLFVHCGRLSQRTMSVLNKDSAFVLPLCVTSAQHMKGAQINAFME